jgi:hypothetical protein
MWALVDTDSTADTEWLGDVWFPTLFVEDDTFYAIPDWRTECMTFRHAFLWLTVVLFQHCNSHFDTSGL